jgi:hypothetical protein
MASIELHSFVADLKFLCLTQSVPLTRDMLIAKESTYLF